MTNNKRLIILGIVPILVILIFVSVFFIRLLESPKETIFVFEKTESEEDGYRQEPDTETENEKESLVRGLDIESVDPAGGPAEGPAEKSVEASVEESTEEPAEKSENIKDEPLAEKTQPENIDHSGSGFWLPVSSSPSSSPDPLLKEEESPPVENGEEEEEEKEPPKQEKEQPIVCSPPFPEPMRGEQIYSVSGSAANPRLARVTIDPLDVNKFATQIVTVLARDTAGNNITSVQGQAFTDNTSFTFEMELISGTEDNGTWQGQWYNQNEYCSNYRLAVRAVSASGSSQAVLTFR